MTGIFAAPDPLLGRGKQERFTAYTYAFGELISASDPTGLAKGGHGLDGPRRDFD